MQVDKYVFPSASLQYQPPVNELRYSNSIKDSYSVTKLFVGAKQIHISQVV